MNTPNTLQELCALSTAGAPLKFRFFLDYEPAASRQITNACLSQWWPCLFTVDGKIFPTAEHFMMYQKALLFEDIETAARILDCDHPFQAKTLGRFVRRFEESRWNQARLDIVIRGNTEKFSQNPALLSFLLGTGCEILAEASPNDLIWGTGIREDDPRAQHPEHWAGQNLLGFALMKARETLRLAGQNRSQKPILAKT